MPSIPSEVAESGERRRRPGPQGQVLVGTLGPPQQRGWLKNNGLSWQIVPTVLGEAMLKMVKLDISALKQAYEQS